MEEISEIRKPRNAEVPKLVAFGTIVQPVPAMYRSKSICDRLLIQNDEGSCQNFNFTKIYL